MIGSCPVTIAADALAQDVLASADCLIANQVQQSYASLLAPGGTFAAALTIALTIYVAIFGYRLILGQSSLTLGEVVPHFIKIGIVFALATSWPSYQTLVFDTLFHGPEQIADVIVRQASGSGTAQGDVMAALQAVFDRLTDAAGDAWAQTPAAAPPTATVVPAVQGAVPVTAAPASALPQLGAPQFVAALLWTCALVLMSASVGVLLVVRIVLALLLLLGPVFVAFALFRATRGLAEGWLRVTVKFALVPLFALPLIAVAVAVLGPLVASLGEAPVAGVRDSPALLIFLVVLVFAAVMVQAARLGGGIAGGIRLLRRPPAVSSERGPPAPSAPALRISDGGPGASRAETIVQAIDAGDRRIGGSNSNSAPALIPATRTITGPVSATPLLANNNARLGQGYRRLAIGQSAAPLPARTRN